MKILQVTTISDTVNDFLLPQIDLLAQAGHQVDVACELVAAPKWDEKNHPTHCIHFSRSPLKVQNVTAYRQMYQLLKQENYDLIHTHTPCASAITRLAASGMGVKVLYTVHGFHFFEGAPAMNWRIYYTMERLLARFTDGLVTMNEEDYQVACQLPIRQAGSVYQVHGVGIDLETQQVSQIRKDYQLATDEQIICFVGELSERKNQRILIEALALLKQEGRKVKLFLVGDGTKLEDYQDLARQQGVEDEVIFTGYCENVQRFLEGADVVASASKQEGLPVNIMEALFFHTPCVVSDIRGHRDLITDDQLGLVVKNNATAMAHGIGVVLDHSEEFTPYLSEAYQVDSVMSEMTKVYQEFER
ncbi:MAG: glycosyltransferase family 4 protein [Enterococcus sp.]